MNKREIEIRKRVIHKNIKEKQNFISNCNKEMDQLFCLMTNDYDYRLKKFKQAARRDQIIIVIWALLALFVIGLSLTNDFAKMLFPTPFFIIVPCIANPILNICKKRKNFSTKKK